MTNYEKIKSMYEDHSHMVPQPPYDKATEMIAEELGLTTKDVLNIVMSGTRK